MDGSKSRVRQAKIIFAVIALLVSGAALAYGVTCPVDNSSAYFTGQTQIDTATGKLLKLYKCPRGHTFWVVN